MNNKKNQLGLLSLIFALLPFLSIIAPIIAITGIVTGIIHYRKEKAQDTKKLLVMSTAGLILSCVTSILYIILFSNLIVSNVLSKQSELSQEYKAVSPNQYSDYELPLISKEIRGYKNKTVKLKINLQYEQSEKLKAELKDRTEEIQHIIGVLISEDALPALSSTEKLSNFSELLKNHINLRLISGKIKGVVIQDISIK